MSGRNEKPVMQVMESLGYVLDKDFVRQHPVGQRYVIDFAFIPEKIAIEIDGSNHTSKLDKKRDLLRDRYLKTANWVTIRVNEKEFFGYKGSFYKSLIKEMVDERRIQLEKGNLYDIEFKKFNENDYDFR